MGDAGGSGEEPVVRKEDLGPYEKAVEAAKEELRIAQEELTAAGGSALSMEKCTARISAVVGFFKDKVDTFLT